MKYYGSHFVKEGIKGAHLVATSLKEATSESHIVPVTAQQFILPTFLHKGSHMNGVNVTVKVAALSEIRFVVEKEIPQLVM